MKKDWYLIVAIAAALVSRLIFAFSWHEVWWDAGVYLGMGKYIFSLGQSGLWEHIRPPLLPLFLGFFWLLGAPVLLGRLLEVALMAGVVFFIYDLSRSWFDRRVAFIAALLVCFSPIFLYLSFHLYTEIPAMFMVLFSIWLFVRKRYLWAGIALGLAFLAKFPAGIFLPVLCAFCLRRLRSLFKLLIGFALPVVPYLAVSWIAYGSPLAFYFAASDAIGRALGCNVLRYREWYYYFWLLWNSEIKFSVFAVPGIVALFLDKVKVRYLLLACVFIPLVYFMQLHCRDYRYLALFYPFVAVLAAYGFVRVFGFLKGRWFSVVAVLLMVWFAFVGFQYYFGNELQSPDPVAEEYYSFLQGRQIDGEVWISNPVVAAHTDAALQKIYYPIYDEGVSRQFSDYLGDDVDRIQFVMLDNCGGGLICAEEDVACSNMTRRIISVLDSRFDRVYDEKRGRCWYSVWST